jgi:hypothetical protein
MLRLTAGDSLWTVLDKAPPQRPLQTPDSLSLTSIYDENLAFYFFVQELPKITTKTLF